MGVLAMAQEKSGGMVSFPCRRFQKGCWSEIEDDVAPETSIILNFPGLPPRRLWAYPEELDLLALGRAAAARMRRFHDLGR